MSSTMSETQAAESVPRAHAAPPRLSALSFLICLSILLAIFTSLNPIWEVQDMRAWNENIWWSYIPIPFLVILCLALERKLVFSAILLETMKLTFVKFVITITAANALWAWRGTPGGGPQPEPAVDTERAGHDFEPLAAPAPTPLDPATLGEFEGSLRDRDGVPVANALVWIAAGLEAVVFAPPEGALALCNDGHGFAPSFAVARAWQALELRSTDGALHTALIEDVRGRRLLNYPVLAGEARTLMFHRDRGVLTVRCSVHGQSETAARLLVSQNPFHTRTDAQGRFRFVGVPAGQLVLRVLHPGAQDFEQPLRLEPGRRSEALLLALP